MVKPYSHSWVTQRMANRLPLWSDARLLRSSWLQQYLNTIGIVHEDLYKQLATVSNNYYVSTANLDEIDVVYKVYLPRNFNFSINDTDPANPITIPPIVTINIDGVDTNIEVAKNNDIESFWYAASPTRIKLWGDTTDVSNIILPPTELQDLSSAVFNTFPLEGRLSITLKGANDFINIKRVIQQGFVKITGTTRKGQQDTENIPFITNTTLTTLKEWRRLDSIVVHGIFPQTATVSVDVFSFNVEESIDLLNLYIDEVNELLLFTSVDNGDYTPILQHKTMVATNLGLLQQGFTGFDVREQAELLDENGGPITAIDFALQLFSDKVFILGDDKLYTYYNKMPYPNHHAVNDETDETLMVVNTNRISYIRNQTVCMYSDRKFPIKRIIKNRYTLIKPDGSRVRLGLDSSEWPIEQSGWILNAASSTLQFNKQKINYIPTQLGTYIIQLDVFYHDGETQTDKHAFNVNALTPDTTLDLPVSMHNADGISFDSDQNLWIKKGNTAHKIQLFTDNMIVDFTKKIIYFHEDYDKVIVQTGV